jgi:hypothetical protein
VISGKILHLISLFRMRLVAFRPTLRRVGYRGSQSRVVAGYLLRSSRTISSSCTLFNKERQSSADQHGTEAANFPSPQTLTSNIEVASQNDLIEPTDKELAFIGGVLKRLNKPSGSRRLLCIAFVSNSVSNIYSNQGVKDQLINDPESPAMRDIRLQQEILYRVRAKQGKSFLWKLLTPLTSRKNELLLTSSAFYVSVREQAEKPAWRGVLLMHAARCTV